MIDQINELNCYYFDKKLCKPITQISKITSPKGSPISKLILIVVILVCLFRISRFVDTSNFKPTKINELIKNYGC